MRRRLVVSWLALVLALSTAWPARAEDPELAAGVRQAQQGDFDAAIATLGGVVRRLAGQNDRAKELARALTYLAVAHHGLGHEQEARSRFLDALKADPGLSVTAREFPPRILSFLEDVRREAGLAAAPATPAEKPAAAAGPSIDHQPVQCLVADRYPRLAARLAPADQVNRARVYFRATGPHWYYVDMKGEAGAYAGVLPKPMKTTKRIEYYVEGVDRAFAESRTSEFAPDVVETEGLCHSKILAAFLPKANVLVGAPAGAPPLPPGFDPAGLASATGQASSTQGTGQPASTAAKAAGGGAKTLLIVGAGAAVAAGVAVAVGGGSSKPTTPPCNPSPDFDFSIDFAFSGSVNCGASNPRVQTYRITNRSCAAVSVQSLRVDKSAAGNCNVTAVENLSLNGSSAVPGASGTSVTVVIRTGAASGTAHMLCCSAYPCRVGSCSINESYTVTTSAGTKTLTNAVSVTDNTGQDCVPCSGAVGPRLSGQADAPGNLHWCTGGAY